MEVQEHGNRMVWEARQHWRDIHTGDAVYLWVAGRHGGVAARATVETEPGYIADEPWEKKHYIKPLPPDATVRRVVLNVHDVLPHPISRDVVRGETEMANHLLFRFSQLTNFPLTDSQAARLDRLFDEWRERRAESSGPAQKTAPAPGTDGDHLNQNVHERNIEDVVVKDPACVEPGLVVVGRQYNASGVGRIDLLCKDKDDHYVVIEIKRPIDAGESVVQQTAMYMAWVKEKLAGDDIVRGIILGPTPTERLRYAAKAVPHLAVKSLSVQVLDAQV